MKKAADIFNDVIGPVMRGPSSSHTAASWRIARTSVDILNEQVTNALVEFARDGAWAPNYREQGTCMGINGGLLGLDESVVELWLPIAHGASSVETGCPDRVSKNWDQGARPCRSNWARVHVHVGVPLLRQGQDRLQELGPDPCRFAESHRQHVSTVAITVIARR